MLIFMWLCSIGIIQTGLTWHKLYNCNKIIETLKTHPCFNAVQK